MVLFDGHWDSVTDQVSLFLMPSRKLGALIIALREEAYRESGRRFVSKFISFLALFCVSTFVFLLFLSLGSHLVYRHITLKASLNPFWNTLVDKTELSEME